MCWITLALGIPRAKSLIKNALFSLLFAIVLASYLILLDFPFCLVLIQFLWEVSHLLLGSLSKLLKNSYVSWNYMQLLIGSSAATSSNDSPLQKLLGFPMSLPLCLVLLALLRFKLFSLVQAWLICSKLPRLLPESLFFYLNGILLEYLWRLVEHF